MVGVVHTTVQGVLNFAYGYSNCEFVQVICICGLYARYITNAVTQSINEYVVSTVINSEREK